MRDLPTGDRVLRLCQGCMQELHAQYRRLSGNSALASNKSTASLFSPAPLPNGSIFERATWRWWEQNRGSLKASKIGVYDLGEIN
jgi:hypothetical protein